MARMQWKPFDIFETPGGFGMVLPDRTVLVLRGKGPKSNQRVTREKSVPQNAILTDDTRMPREVRFAFECAEIALTPIE